MSAPEALYRYTTKDADKNVEISFLIPPETNIKKFLKIAITRDTISVFDSRTSQPIILGKLFDVVVDHSYSKLEVIKNGENYGEVEIILEKKNRNSFWPLLIVNSKSGSYQTKEIDDHSEFLLSIANKTRDPTFAAQCLTNAAEKGNENALFEYATHSAGILDWKMGTNTPNLVLETDMKKALKYYERFLDFHPHQYLVNYRVGFIYKNFVHDNVKAKHHLTQSFQNSTGYPDAALLLAQILYLEEDERQYPQVIAYYRFALEGGLSDLVLDDLLVKLKKEQQEKVAALELKKKQEAEEAAEQVRLKEAKEAEDLRILLEIERTNKLYGYIGALVIGGAVVVGAYLHWNKNPK
jgi:uncharacterized glyoxalase superfamily protein PhnB